VSKGVLHFSFLLIFSSDRSVRFNADTRTYANHRPQYLLIGCENLKYETGFILRNVKALLL
jgi:hypothetical protein